MVVLLPCLNGRPKSLQEKKLEGLKKFDILKEESKKLLDNFNIEQNEKDNSKKVDEKYIEEDLEELEMELSGKKVVDDPYHLLDCLAK